MSHGAIYCTRCGLPMSRPYETDFFMHDRCRELQKQEEESFGGMKPNRAMRRALERKNKKHS